MMPSAIFETGIAGGESIFDRYTANLDLSASLGGKP
jgi:hypothetical protein